MAEYDVAIVGAGVAGCISAYELARDHDVLVVDKGPVAGETTGRSSGLITVTTDVLVPRAAMLDVPEMASHVNEYVRALDGTGGDAPFSLDGVALDRFDSRDVDFEFQPIGGGAMRE